LLLYPDNARPRRNATAPTLYKAGGSHRVLGEVIRPIIAGKLAAEGFPLCGLGAGLLIPVIESEALEI